MAVNQTEMLKNVALSMPNMTSESAKQVAEDWEKNPGKMFADNNNTNFLNTLSTFVLDRIRVRDFYNPLEDAEVITRSSQPYGNIQRMYVPEIKSVDADFQKPWQNGQSSDMFKKRVIKPTQKFAYSNISYNNRITVPGSMFYTSAFTNYNGLVDWNAAVLQTMLNGYSRWRFALYMDIIGRQTNAENLQADQEINVTFADVNNPTIKEVAEFCKAVENVKSMARLNGGKFNEDKFRYSVKPDDIKILVRTGFVTACRFALAQGSAEGFSINPERINAVLDSLIEVPYLGVPEYYQEEAFTNKLYPVYDENGMIKELNTKKNGSGVAVSLDAAYVKDSSDVVAEMIDKNRINFVSAVGADGVSTEMRTDYTIYNIEGDYRNLYLRVLGNPSEGAGARLFADSSYLLVKFVNNAQA